MVWDVLWGTVEGWIVIAVTLLSVAVALGLRIFIRKQIGDFYSFFHWVLMEAFQELQFSTCKCDKREGFCTLHPFGGVGNLYEYFFDFIFGLNVLFSGFFVAFLC